MYESLFYITFKFQLGLVIWSKIKRKSIFSMEDSSPCVLPALFYNDNRSGMWSRLAMVLSVKHIAVSRDVKWAFVAIFCILVRKQFEISQLREWTPIRKVGVGCTTTPKLATTFPYLWGSR